MAPPALGAAAYHGIAGEFLRAVGPYTEATDAGILAHLLPAVATLVGPGPYIFAGNEQFARLFTVLVGPTNSGRKGTAAHPIDRLMLKVDREFWQGQRANGLSSGEGLIQRVADIRTKDDDGKPKTVPVEKRLYVVEEELSRVLANIRREGNILSQVIRAAFDSGDLATLTVEPRQANGAHICIVGHITPRELKERLNHVEMANGFGNRFLWFFVKSDKLLPRPKPIPSEIFRRFAERLRALYVPKSRSVELDDGAMKRWEGVYPELRQDRPGLSGAMVARGSAIVLRLALLYALMDKKKKIGVEHLEAALAVWDYNTASAKILFQSATGDPLADKILELLGTGPMTRTEMNKHLSYGQKQLLGGALQILVKAKLARSVKVKREGAGRPATRWELCKGKTQ